MTAAPAGYAALRESAACLDLSSRGKIRVLGEDRARLLHAMTTNHIEQLVPGAGCYAYFLSAQGRILADVSVFCREDMLLLDTEPETRAKVFEHLDKFIIADDVTLDDATEQIATLALEGPAAASILKAVGAPVPDAEYANAAWRSGLVAKAGYTGGPGFLLIPPVADRAGWIHDLISAGAEEGSLEAFEIVRLENGKPRYGQDLTERFLAQEANQTRALHFNKGCYLGQEIVERVRSRGQVHRVLVPLEIANTQAPAPGTKLTEAGANIAEITSAAFSPALGKVVALAYVRTDRAQPGTRFMLDGVDAIVGRARA